ncbi:MAG: hypothetical protein RBT05_10770 [Bacteroidales bacterium]|jgi:small subunit ribosomal protein S15|nr:hypothetical protein [Bacteroidales bacterium]
MVKIKAEKKPVKPVWLKTTEEELKKIIVKLAEKYSPAQIGLILRDQYGIPTTKMYGKKLGEYLNELNLKTDSELENAQKKLERLQEHFSRNITDKRAKHKLQKAQGKTNTLKRYSLKKKK